MLLMQVLRQIQVEVQIGGGGDTSYNNRVAAPPIMSWLIGPTTKLSNEMRRCASQGIRGGQDDLTPWLGNPPNLNQNYFFILRI